MLYKQLEDGSWLVSEKEVFTPKEKINIDNQTDGWKWHEEPHQDYLDWEEKNKEEI